MPVLNLKDEDKDKDEDINQTKNQKKINHLNEDEVSKIVAKPNFQRFIRKGSGILDKEMSDNESLYEDMMERNEVGAEGDKTMLNFSFNFQDESVKNFTATNICWSRINAESLLATYGTSDITEKYPSKILIWSMKNKLKPQHVINCEKKITRAIFHPTSDNIIFAATISGNIY